MSTGVELILCESVAGLGSVGDRVAVKGGYAWNYLIPQNKAILLTEENKLKFEQERVELEKRSAEQKKLAQEQVNALKDFSIEHVVKTSADGKLFGSVTVRDVMKMLNDKDINISKQNVKLLGGNIHHAGKYQVELTFYADVVAIVDLDVLSNHPEYDASKELEAEEIDLDEVAAEDAVAVEEAAEPEQE